MSLWLQNRRILVIIIVWRVLWGNTRRRKAVMSMCCFWMTGNMIAHPTPLRDGGLALVVFTTTITTTSDIRWSIVISVIVIVVSVVVIVVALHDCKHIPNKKDTRTEREEGCWWCVMICSFAVVCIQFASPHTGSMLKVYDRICPSIAHVRYGNSGKDFQSLHTRGKGLKRYFPISFRSF